MIIGHLPGAYLVYKLGAPRGLSTAVFLAGMAGALFPDIDLLWFYFVDNRGHHHHEYLTHRPAIWLGLLIVFFVFTRLPGKRWGLLGLSFCAGAIVHVVLDSITGRIFWLWPLSDATVTLVTVLPTHSHFMLSFLAHWTFKVELVVTAIAGAVFLRSRYRRVRAVAVAGGDRENSRKAT